MFRLMTQSNKDVRNDRGIELPYDREPCVIVNFSLAAIIILVFVYAAVFSPTGMIIPLYASMKSLPESNVHHAAFLTVSHL